LKREREEEEKLEKSTRGRGRGKKHKTNTTTTIHRWTKRKFPRRRFGYSLCRAQSTKYLMLSSNVPFIMMIREKTINQQCC